MKWRFPSLMVIAVLVGSCSESSSRCDAELSKAQFQIDISQLGANSIWINDCGRSYFIAPGSEKDLESLNSIASRYAGGAAFSGILSGKIIYLESIKDPAVQIDSLQDVKRIDIPQRNALHDLIVSQRLRPRNSDVTF